MAKILSINLQGKAHQADHKPCEDALYIHEEPLVCCLSDGVSQSRYGKIGADSLVKYIGEYLSDPQNLKLLNDRSIDEIQTIIYQLIQQTLQFLCNKYNVQNENDFAATFMACYVFDDVLTVIHAGDGAIFAKSRTKIDTHPIILSYPDDNEYDQVYHAGHKETINRLRVMRIRLGDIQSVLLATDGFSNAYVVPSYQGFDNDSLQAVFKIHSQKQWLQLIHENHYMQHNITDDISAILIHFHEQGQLIKDHSINTNNDQYLQINNYQKNRSLETLPAKKRKSKINKKNIFGLLKALIVILIIAMNVYLFIQVYELTDQINQQNDIIQQDQQDIKQLQEEIQDLQNNEQTTE